MADFIIRAVEFGVGKLNRAQLSIRAQLQLLRYRETGDPVLAEDSVRLWRRTLAATPKTHPDRVLYLANLGGALRVYFGVTADTADLVEAIEVLREGYEVTHRSHGYWGLCAGNLAGALSQLFDQTGDLAFLEEALQIYRDSLPSTLRFGDDRGSRLMGFSIALSSMFEQTGDLRFLTEALQMSRQAVESTPPDDPDRYIRFATLANQLDDMFDETGDLDFLTQSLKAYRQSVASTVAGHRRRGLALSGLGAELMTLYEVNKDDSVLAEASSAFAEAAAMDLAPPTDRITAYRSWAGTAVAAGDATSALACYEQAIGLLPQVAPRNLTTANEHRSVLDRVVSSYTPTIRALRYARQNRTNRTERASSALIVAMPVTPMADSLPGAEGDINLLKSLIPGSKVLTGKEATRESVIESLPDYRIAHFSCHCLSDRSNPAASKLLLQDHVQNPLTVTNLSALKLTDSELAFLSACETSGTSSNLIDEAVHITSAFQLAGYQNVIGTLWPVLDAVSELLAKLFYTRLVSGEANAIRLADTARILHESVRELRERYPDAPAFWAAFIHAGI